MAGNGEGCWSAMMPNDRAKDPDQELSDLFHDAAVNHGLRDALKALLPLGDAEVVVGRPHDHQARLNAEFLPERLDVVGVGDLRLLADHKQGRGLEIEDGVAQIPPVPG